ncbi:NAD(P)H-dependent oxidoreductase subunit E [Candidatus Woesearchaeota archaeon]|nr:NAD(P)H-dependent oxidoreductase subunit E [Candidatus Woesearchaeota archaeon]
MVFLRRVSLGKREYYYLFHTEKINGILEKFNLFVGEVEPTPKKLESLKANFLKSIQKNPQKLIPPKHPNVLATLQEIQERQGYIGELDFVKASKELGIPAIDLVGVATFYSQFKLAPPAKYKIKICDGTACHVQGSLSLLDILEKELGLKPGETTADGLFSLEVVRCLGICASAPVMLINEQLHSKLTIAKLNELVSELKTRK